MSRTAAQKYAFFERLVPTACITLALVLPISAALHMPDISFIMSSVGAGLLFFLGWQATLRHMHAAVPAAFFSVRDFPCIYEGCSTDHSNVCPAVLSARTWYTGLFILSHDLG
jgi:hypothetical protein